MTADRLFAVVLMDGAEIIEIIGNPRSEQAARQTANRRNRRYGYPNNGVRFVAKPTSEILKPYD